LRNGKAKPEVVFHAMTQPPRDFPPKSKYTSNRTNSVGTRNAYEVLRYMKTEQFPIRIEEVDDDESREECLSTSLGVLVIKEEHP
jgi:hypothetical protein